MENKPNSIVFRATVNGKPAEECTDPFVGRLVRIAEKAMNNFRDDLASSGGAVPGEFPDWDRRAWGRLQRAGFDVSEWMLMHHESDEKAAFKNIDTRKYITV